jgi:uncharacterized protein YcbK (DUF882 family)
MGGLDLPPERLSLVGSKGPSEHLSWAELACHDGTPYPEEWRADRAVQLAEAFEAIRAEAGGFPLLITSAYRTPEWNARVHGVPNSEHVEGRALDIVPIRGVSVQQLFEAAKRVRLRGKTKLAGLGRYFSFIHIDIRPGSWATWGGKAGD